MSHFQLDAKQIVCILPKGKASMVEQGLIEDHGIHDANFHHARGVGKFSALSAKGLGEQQEKTILQLVVSKEMAETIFEYIYFRAGLDQPHGGLVYMAKVPKMALMKLPEPAEQEEGAESSG
ncbi:MAG: hypothetical protein QGG67_13315 [Gammaproteobacteria bacterium]|jgi:nitrogen regulatory protein PII|nr:hypothetical protein [Gammaproteobacteria bacterium]MDP6096941.1 hypothetical protein [Gammaproteobacteria bacterium]|tara:strand:+ start:1231 stop:1596 length:366 start_codon:yes stop_codon:yes gene_type:complete